MAIDPDYLLNIDLPEVRQSVGPQEYALYALSIGVGQDPMDERQLRYVGGFEEIEPFPAMPVVLGHPGFWLADPKTGVDAVRLVHGEQGLTVHAPCPSAGAVVGKTRVTGLVDKGEAPFCQLLKLAHCLSVHYWICSQVILDGLKPSASESTQYSNNLF